jgi:PKD repeat protein
LRNPFRFDIDPVTGVVYVGDVGQVSWEEVSLGNTSGENFGWPYYEGYVPYRLTPCPTDIAIPSNTRFPIYAYAHGAGASVMGTTVYRGVNFPFDASFPPEFEGNYFLMEFYQNFMRVLRYNATTTAFDLVPGVTATNWGDGYDGTADMVVGPDGALYLVNLYDGSLRRIAYPPVANAPPVASFTVTPPTPVNPGVPFSFDATASYDPDGAIASYDWDFGDGNLSTGVAPTHAYATGGTYTVTLTVTDNASATDAATRGVSVNLAPVAAFTMTPPPPVNPGTLLTFNASASSDPDSAIASYTWDFGDGNPGSGVSPTHSYASGGTYVVSLTVVDDLGLSNSTTQPVAVNRPPLASFTATPDWVNPGVAVAFNATTSSDPDGPLSAFDWDFGDGAQAAGAVVSHAYTAAGDYLVRLIATDPLGLNDTATAPVHVNFAPSASFSASPQPANVGVPMSFDGTSSTDVDGSIVAYDWDFGDTSTATGPLATHAYAAAGSYLVTLTVTDNMTLTHSVNQTVAAVDAPPQLPVAALSHSPAVSLVGAVVDFDGSASYDPDGTITSYLFDFGDGGSANGTAANATHAYLTFGTYTATLTVTDNSGANSTATNIVVVNDPPRAAPVAWAPGPVVIGTPVLFDGGNSTDADGVIDNYSWTFGDGAVGFGVVATHTYAAQGVFTATLTVRDNRGATGTAMVEVAVGNRPPTAVIVVDPANGTTDTEFTFNGSASADLDGTIVAYLWDFGDGTNATGAVVTHRFPARGPHGVNLTVWDDDGANGTAAVVVALTNRGPEILAWDPPVPVFTDVFDYIRSWSVNASDPDGDPLNYTWTADGSVIGHGSAVWYAPPEGTHTLVVTVTDGELNATHSWTVVSEPMVIPLPGSITWFCALAGILVVAVIVLVLLLMRRRKAPPDLAPISPAPVATPPGGAPPVEPPAMSPGENSEDQ